MWNTTLTTRDQMHSLEPTASAARHFFLLFIIIIIILHTVGELNVVIVVIAV